MALTALERKVVSLGEGTVDVEHKVAAWRKDERLTQFVVFDAIPLRRRGVIGWNG